MKKKVLIFGGTSEGRDIAWKLNKADIFCTVCVATEYGEYAMGAGEKNTDNSPQIHVGRMNSDEMRRFITGGGYSIVVDATHPHAAEVSQNVRSALSGTGIALIKLNRNVSLGGGGDEAYTGIRYFDDFGSCVKALREAGGNILFTTGVKELGEIKNEEMIKRSYVRILPSAESLENALKAGISRAHIIAVQGPFSMRMNTAMIEEYDIKVLVSKASGDAGGYGEKIQAAKKAGIDVFVIRPPRRSGADADSNIKSVEFDNTGECVRYICREFGIVSHTSSAEISLIGMGMGNDMLLTREASAALCNLDVYFGSPRLVSLLPDNVLKYPIYEPKDVISRLRKLIVENAYGNIKAAVLYSGDTGFFSGAKRMSAMLKAFSDNSGIEISVRAFPGQSSIAYLSAKTGISYGNAVIISHHGRRSNVIAEILKNRKVFLLLSDAAELKLLAQKICNSGYEDITIHAGYDLSSAQEKIISVRAHDHSELPETGICCAFIINDGDLLPLTPSLGDGFFKRGTAPMTKEEIRQLSVCKLKLPEDAILYDIGSGTGSIAVECGRLSNDIKVYAIEKNEEAAGLTAKNASRAGLENVSVISGTAPEAFAELEAPTHVFIGGSDRRLEDIIRAIMLKRQGRVRIVINVVTLETLSAVNELLAKTEHGEEEIVGIQLSRSVSRGRYHLMKSENMIYIVSFEI